MEIQDKTYDLNVLQTAELLGYHPQTVRDLARKGALPALKRRHAWFFNQQEIEALIASQSKEYIDRSKTKHDLQAEFGDDATGTDSAKE